MTEEKKKRPVWQWGIILVAIPSCLCFALLVASPSSDTEPIEVASIPTDQEEVNEVATQEEIDTPQSTSTPSPTATPLPIAPSFEEIESQVKSMTEAQWKAYLPTLKGLRVVDWSGWVTDVDKGLFGDFTLWLDMDPPGSFSIQDIYIPIPESIALEFQKEQQVTISGIIDHVSELLGSISVTFEEGAILEY